MEKIVKDATTEELVEELVSRGAAQAVSTGSYQQYELTTKYTNAPKQSIACDTVLLVGEQKRLSVSETLHRTSRQG